MIKQKYNITIVPTFSTSRFLFRMESVLIPCVNYAVYCNGEFTRNFLTEDDLKQGLRMFKDLIPRSQELVVSVDYININNLKF